MGCEKGDVALLGCDRAILGALRKPVAEKLGLIDNSLFNYVWITDMPFFAKEDDENGNSTFVAMHHPFTCPTDESMQYIDTDKSKVYAKAYDLVVNGVELLSGSIRITDHELQEKMFKALGLTAEEIDQKFGFLVEAYKYAAPPHGGAGFGLDRLAMVLCGADNLRDVTAFPKLKDASEPMSDCPAQVDAVQLKELNIKLED
jgi:aspartyl-tRNA synthetase